MAADAHACGAQDTGYSVGLSPGRRWNPQKSSGRRCRSKKMLASRRPERIFAASVLNPYRASPAAMSALS